MTSLTETLPVLDEAVPALPAKVEAVARAGDAFGQAALDALSSIAAKRQQADTVAEQVREALVALRDQAAEEQQAIESAARELKEACDEEADGVDTGGDELKTSGDQAVAAFAGLESQLTQGADRTRAAQEEARTALEGLASQAGTSQTELDGAVDEMTAALHAAEQTIAEGETLVVEGVSSLLDAMTRLLGEAHTRLQQTHGRLDELRNEQEAAVTEAASQLDTERERLGQEVVQFLDAEVRQALTPEVEAVLEVMGEVGQAVVAVEGETQKRREDLEEELTGLTTRIPPLQGGVVQVKVAANQVGISWP